MLTQKTSGPSVLQTGRVLFLPLGAIRPNPAQPRSVFDAAGLQELAASIRQYGVLQPLSVRKKGSGFELVAGASAHRRRSGAAAPRAPDCGKRLDGRENRALYRRAVREIFAEGKAWTLRPARYARFFQHHQSSARSHPRRRRRRRNRAAGDRTRNRSHHPNSQIRLRPVRRIRQVSQRRAGSVWTAALCCFYFGQNKCPKKLGLVCFA